jgi:hypothetical protein
VELRNLPLSQNDRLNKSRRVRWEGYLAPLVEQQSVTESELGNMNGRGKIGKARHKWNNFVETEC